MLNIIDEFSRECLAIRVRKRLNSMDVIDTLTDLFIIRDVPSHSRSDNGPEFIAEAVKLWTKAVGAKTASISSLDHPGRAAIARASAPVSRTSS